MVALVMLNSTKKSGHCEGCVSLFLKVSSSCFTCSKERFDHMVALVMLNSTKNQAICYNVKVLDTILQVKFVVIYIMNSSSTFTYKMCKAFMSHFTCLGVTTLKIKWTSVNPVHNAPPPPPPETFCNLDQKLSEKWLLITSLSGCSLEQKLPTSVTHSPDRSRPGTPFLTSAIPGLRSALELPPIALPTDWEQEIPPSN
jgi:hypothetical protein